MEAPKSMLVGASRVYCVWGMAALPLEALSARLAQRVHARYVSLPRLAAHALGADPAWALARVGQEAWSKAQAHALETELASLTLPPRSVSPAPASLPSSPLAPAASSGSVAPPAPLLINFATFGLNSEAETEALRSLLPRPHGLFLDASDSALAALAGLNRPRSLALGMPRLWLKMQAQELRARAQELGLELCPLEPEREIDEIVTMLAARL